MKARSLEIQDLDDDPTTELEAKIEQMRVKIMKMEEVIGQGTTKATLDEAKRDPFMAARLSAHGIKERLISRIQARKFELSKLAQSSGRPALGKSLECIYGYIDTSYRQ